MRFRIELGDSRADRRPLLPAYSHATLVVPIRARKPSLQLTQLGFERVPAGDGQPVPPTSGARNRCRAPAG